MRKRDSDEEAADWETRSVTWLVLGVAVPAGVVGLICGLVALWKIISM